MAALTPTHSGQVSSPADSNLRKGRILVVGATGQVGTRMLRLLEEDPSRGIPLATARAPHEGWLQLDLAELPDASAAAALLDPHPLSSIFCIAGMTNVDACEDVPDVAHRTNARGPAALAAYARRLGIPFVYFSTEYVFDGSPANPGPYPEDAPTNALSVYGKSKLAGELAVLDAHPEALVLRTTVVYGPDSREKNYLYSLMRNLTAGTPMRVPQDQVSTPTYNQDLILTALGLVQGRASGIFHVCGPELLGRLQFAQAVATHLGLDASLLHGVSTATLGQRAPRPLAAGLATDKLRSLYPHLRMRTVAEALADCAPELNAFLNRQPAPTPVTA